MTEKNNKGKASAQKTVKKKTGNNKTKKAGSKGPASKAGKVTPGTVKEKEQQDWKDKYLRLSAEFDNYRKRTLKEKADLTKFAGEEILKHFLPVIDDLDRARQSMESANDLNALKEGLNLISNKLSDFLAKEGVEEIDCFHKEFEPENHEAVTKIPAPEKKLKGKIIDVIEKGYNLKGKIIRYPKVVIGE